MNEMHCNMLVMRIVMYLSTRKIVCTCGHLHVVLNLVETHNANVNKKTDDVNLSYIAPVNMVTCQWWNTWCNRAMPISMKRIWKVKLHTNWHMILVTMTLPHF